MAKCLACGSGALFTSSIGEHKICNGCAGKINYSSWKKREFKSIDELIEQKSKTLKLANEANFSNEAINAITNYFDEYINDGYITIISGKFGQKIKIFADYCIIITKGLQRESLVESLKQLIAENDINGNTSSMLSSSETKSLVNGLMKGKLVQAGIGLATSAAINSAEKQKDEERKQALCEKLVVSGEYRVNLSGISDIDVYTSQTLNNGYLRFVPNGLSVKDYYSCVYFVFNTSIPFQSKKIKQQVITMCDLMTKRIPVIKNGTTLPTASSSPNTNADTFETIRKFKELLDEGIISEEEFNAKKKELLGL